MCAEAVNKFEEAKKQVHTRNRYQMKADNFV